MRILFVVLSLTFLTGCNVQVVSPNKPYYNHQYEMQRHHYNNLNYIQRHSHNKRFHRSRRKNWNVK